MRSWLLHDLLGHQPKLGNLKAPEQIQHVNNVLIGNAGVTLHDDRQARIRRLVLSQIGLKLLPW